MILHSVFYYLILSSGVLVYGVGLTKLITASESPKNLISTCIKTILATAATISLTWLVANNILVTMKALSLLPFFIILFTAFFSMILQRLILSTFKIDTSEFSLTFLTSFVALSEGDSIISSLVIGFTIILSFYFLVPLINAIRYRINKVTIHTDMKSGAFLLLILAVLIFALYFWNISWLNEGVYL